MKRPITQESSGRLLTGGSPSEMAERATWRDFWTLTKPGINASNLMAAFTGFWLAGYDSFNMALLLATLLGTALVIAGGCTVNNFIDRDIDPLMARTQNRPVAAGRIRPPTALWMGILLGLAGVTVLLALVNPLSALLAAIGFFVYVFVYTAWTKRTTVWNTVVGSVSGAVPPMIGWVAVEGTLDLPAWMLFLFMFVWQPPHFFALAMMKVEDYRAAGVPMLPVVKGFAETRRQMLFFVALMLPVSIFLFGTGVVSWLYLTMALVLGGAWIYLAVAGWSSEDDEGWARKMFLYSLLYLTLMQVAMFIDPVLFG
ncbi:protoheme IX farnesyltransferase [Melghirimyces profundicolus]|uniref:Protoheme IX farnesyltransferase n=1 Tax=Melghirimyces profundicolus TaxID=1242148 RepID=A0A2T6BXE7_9BACL|nr:heme o synthase [Melghirimyces profundicolus]PTX60733.1 protoheme IX farnesyltransferase [Melghirimyces profundicolus]